MSQLKISTVLSAKKEYFDLKLKYFSKNNEPKRLKMTPENADGNHGGLSRGKNGLKSFRIFNLLMQSNFVLPFDYYNII